MQHNTSLYLIQLNLTMSNKKETVYVKANGLRNELKDIRKSIDTLTHALHILIELQTHKQYESINECPNCRTDDELQGSA